MTQVKIDALYCRVSTDLQREKGESIRNQKERLSAYAKENNLNPQTYIDDGISAKDTNRPALQKLIQDIKENKIRMVLVTKIDRITRNLKDLLDLIMLFEDCEVGFKSLTQPIDTSTAMGRGQVQLMGVFASMEREMTSERVGEDMRHRAKNGKWNGGVVPFGYMVYAQQVRLNMREGMKKDKVEQEAKKKCSIEKKLYLNETEAKIVRQMFDKYLETESLRAVTHWLNTKKYPSRYGTTWAANSVSRVLRSPTYIGKLCQNKRVSSTATGRLRFRPKDSWIIADAEHEPIVSKDKFDMVQKILERQAVEPRRKMSSYLLSGLLRCGKCGASMHGYTYRKQTGKIYSYYKCYAKQQKGESVCKSGAVSRFEIEEVVVSEILKLYKGKALIDMKKALELHRTKSEKSVSPLLREKETLAKRNEEIGRKLKVLLERLEDETIETGAYKTRKKELEDELESNRMKIYSIESQLNDLTIEHISFDAVYEVLKDFKKCWKGAKFQGRKDMLHSIVSKVVYTDRKTPINLELYFLGDVCSRTDRDSWHKR
jgi:site-specific DNA recombinase